MDAILALERSSTGVAERCVWDLPRVKTTLQLSMDVIDRIERDALTAFRAVTERGSEVGGLLLGRVTNDPHVCAIEDYALVRCDYTRGPLYQLSEADENRLREALTQPHGDLAVVGFFRSHTRKEIALDENDAALMDRYFTFPDAMALLVKPFSMKPSRGAFFLRTGETLPLKTPAFEFTFRRRDLEKGMGRTPASAPVVRPAPAAAPPDVRMTVELEALHRKVEAAQPAPVETPAVAPVAASPAPPEAAAKTDLAPAPQAVAAPAPEVEVEPPKPAAVEAAAPVVVPEPEPAPLVQKKAAAPVEVAPAAVAREAEEPPPAPKKTRRRPLWLWLLAALATATAALVVAAMFVTPEQVTSILPLGGDGALSLTVERTAGQIRLGWNRHAGAISQAQKAKLVILDGSQRQELEVDLNQLRTGNLVYAPNTTDVTFQLEVYDLVHGKTWTESVRAVSGRPSPMGPPRAPAPEPQSVAPPQPPAAEETALPVASPATDVAPAAAQPADAPEAAPPVEEPAAPPTAG